MFMSITTGRTDPEADDIICALSWTAVPDACQDQPAGQGHAGADSDADLVFVLSRARLGGGGVFASQRVAWPMGAAFMRLDEVCFPVGAIAHRHTHSGAGFRYLCSGSLRVEATDHSQDMAVGDTWFEPAHTPVRAVALHDTGVTRFVRCMIVPTAFQGKSTFRLVDPADAKLERLQVTHRHIDHPVQVDAG